MPPKEISITLYFIVVRQCSTRAHLGILIKFVFRNLFYTSVSVDVNFPVGNANYRKLIKCP